MGVDTRHTKQECRLNTHFNAREVAFPCSLPLSRPYEDAVSFLGEIRLRCQAQGHCTLTAAVYLVDSTLSVLPLRVESQHMTIRRYFP